MFNFLFFLYEVFTTWVVATPESNIKNPFWSKVHKWGTRFVVVTGFAAILFILFLWLTA